MFYHKFWQMIFKAMTVSFKPPDDKETTGVIRPVLKGQRQARQAAREAAAICSRPLQVDLSAFDLLTLKVVFESRVTWATYVPILVFLGLSVLDLGSMYATDRQTSDAHHRLMPLP